MTTTLIRLNFDKLPKETFCTFKYAPKDKLTLKLIENCMKGILPGNYFCIEWDISLNGDHFIVAVDGEFDLLKLASYI
jgi:hypothetical protein